MPPQDGTAAGTLAAIKTAFQDADVLTAPAESAAPIRSTQRPPASATLLDAGDERLLFWTTQAILFPLIVLGVATVFSSLTRPQLPSGSIPWLVAVRVCTIFGATLVMRSFYRHPRIERLHGSWLVFAVVTACLTAAVLELAAFQLIGWWIMPMALGVVEQYPAFALLARFFVGLIWSATYLLLRQRAVSRQSTAAAVAAELRATQAEVALRESELARLSQHVEPHFLFNALSAVLACRHEPDAVEAVTASLSEYLRFCLARGKDLEPLAHELDATIQLLSVHEARFEEDLCCSVGASPAARRIAVPPMVIAPLVDNALKFARQTSEAPWKISVTAEVADDTLILTVSNSGRWVEQATDRPGTGLANLRRRLELSGIDANLASSEGDGTVSVTLSLPAALPTSVS